MPSTFTYVGEVTGARFAQPGFAELGELRVTLVMADHYVAGTPFTVAHDLLAFEVQDPNVWWAAEESFLQMGFFGGAGTLPGEAFIHNPVSSMSFVDGWFEWGVEACPRSGCEEFIAGYAAEGFGEWLPVQAQASEPASALLLVMGLLAALWARRRVGGRST